MSLPKPDPPTSRPDGGVSETLFWLQVALVIVGGLIVLFGVMG